MQYDMLRGSREGGWLLYDKIEKYLYAKHRNPKPDQKNQAVQWICYQKTLGKYKK